MFLALDVDCDSRISLQDLLKLGVPRAFAFELIPQPGGNYDIQIDFQRFWAIMAA